MANPLEGVEPATLWRLFYELSRIPRPSGHEKAAGDWVIQWAETHKFDAVRDKTGNVKVVVPGTRGRESAPATILQGHIDMVPEKEKDSPHDFEKDPIPIKVAGDEVVTEGTTLGADNGIGVAAAMAAATDPDVSHGPLVLLNTVDEERGLKGASAMAPDFVTGTYLLNLDSEEEACLFVGCAGGADSEITLAAETEPLPKGTVPCAVEVNGLKGGHSGLEIDAGRGNSIKLLNRLVRRAKDELGARIAAMTGGSRRNAIPRDARAELAVAPDTRPELEALCAEMQQAFRMELGKEGADLVLSVKDVTTPAGQVWTLAFANRVCDLLTALPHGVLAMSRDIQGVVETSTNLATLAWDADTLTVGANTRSSVQSVLAETRQGLLAAGRLAFGKAVAGDHYPGWRPDMDSRLLKTARTVIEEVYGKKPVVTAIHAGLECGLLSERLPDLQLISFGPDIRGAHTPDERVSIPSTATFYRALALLLDRLSA